MVIDYKRRSWGPTESSAQHSLKIIANTQVSKEKNMKTLFLIAILGCCFAVALSVPSTSQDELEIQNLRSFLKNARMEEDDEPDINIQGDDIDDGGMNKLKSALAKLQGDIDDGTEDADNQDKAKAQVTYRGLFHYARSFAVYEFRMLHAIRRYVSSHANWMAAHYNLLHRYHR